MCRLRLSYITYVENQPLVLQWFVLFYKCSVWEKGYSVLKIVFRKTLLYENENYDIVPSNVGNCFAEATRTKEQAALGEQVSRGMVSKQR